MGDFVVELLMFLLVVIVGLLVVWLAKIIGYKNLYKRVSFCVGGKYYARYPHLSISEELKHNVRENIYNMYLYEDKFTSPIRDLISDKYKLNASDYNEHAMIDIVAKEYQMYMYQSFFCDQLSINEKVMHLTETQYFILTLHNFLCKQMHYKEFAGVQMMKAVKSEKNEEEYTLSDFGVVYYKLLYATKIYIENTEKKVKAMAGVFTNSPAVRATLDNRRVNLVRYIP